MLYCPERAKLPFPLNYPVAQAAGAVKGVHGTGTAAYLAAVRIRSALDGAGGDVLEHLTFRKEGLGEKEEAAPAAGGLPPRRGCGTGRKRKDHVPVIRGLYLQGKIA